MSASYNFRTAFNGFNREDVVHYIEYINSKHNTQLNQLRTDLAEAQKDASAPKHNPELESQAAELALKVAQLQEEVLAVTAEKNALQAQLAEVTAQRDAAINDQTQVQRRNEEELEAYRRAERVERQAKERTEAMYQKANTLLSDATAKVDSASSQVAAIADQVAAQLTVLQQAVTGSKAALKDAANTLSSLQLNTEE